MRVQDMLVPFRVRADRTKGAIHLRHSCRPRDPQTVIARRNHLGKLSDPAVRRQAEHRRLIGGGVEFDQSIRQQQEHPILLNRKQGKRPCRTQGGVVLKLALHFRDGIVDPATLREREFLNSLGINRPNPSRLPFVQPVISIAPKRKVRGLVSVETRDPFGVPVLYPDPAPGTQRHRRDPRIPQPVLRRVHAPTRRLLRPDLQGQSKKENKMRPAPQRHDARLYPLPVELSSP